MAKKVCIIDKAPSKNDYSKYFDFEFELFHMSQVPITKLLKKDVTLDIDLDYYDLVILVGSEAAKEYAGITSVTNFAGTLKNDKFVCITNPAMLHFKPENKPDFQRSVDKIKKIYEDNISSNKGDYAGIINAEEALAYLYEVLNHPNELVAADTETTALYPRNGYVLGLSMTHKENHGRYILTDILDDRHLKVLQEIFDTKVVIFHNMKFDYKMIRYHLGLDFNRARVHDTMVMHYVLDETDSHSLKHLALKYTDFGDYDAELDSFKKEYCRKHSILEEDFTYDLIPFDIIKIYAAKDTAVTWAIFHKFWPILQANPKLLWVYQNLLIRGTLFLMDMEEVGIPIDKRRMAAAGAYLERELEVAKRDIYAFDEIKAFETATGKIFNPASPMQLRSLLFDYVGLTPTGKLTKTGATSTDAEVLEELSDEHPIPRSILKVRKLSKIKSSYVDKVLPELDRDGRIRTNFNLIFTTSGRLSSSGKFNAQQIVRDDPIIKGCIVAPQGYKIVSQDLATAEVYYAAVLSGDINLQKVFLSGGDLHSTIAKMVFGLPCSVDEVKSQFKSLRQAAKAIN